MASKKLRPGELPDISYDKSLAGLMEKGDKIGAADWQKRAKKGEIMRIM